MRNGYHRGRHIIIAGKNRCRSRLNGQQLFRSLQARSITVEALFDARRLDARIRLAQRGFKSQPPLPAGRLVWMPLDERDPAMTQLQEIPRHFVSGFEVVDADAGGVRAEATGGYRYSRHGAFPQLRQDYMRLADRGRQDDPRHAPVDQTSDGSAFPVRGDGFTFFQHQLSALATAFIQRAEQKLAQIRSAGVAVEQPDPDVFSAGQASRRRIGRVAQVFDRGEYGFTGGFPNVSLAIYNSRNGHRGYAGLARDVMNRRAATAAAAGFSQ